VITIDKLRPELYLEGVTSYWLKAKRGTTTIILSLALV
jgi:hypothetical protein